MRLFVILFALSSPLFADSATNSIGMKLVSIAPGSFTMGQEGPAADYGVKKHAEKFDDADWDERPAHRVKITQGFLMSATEVTVGQYRLFDPKHRGGNDDEAVTAVSWNEAVAFCEWLSKKEGKTYRLPTEAEWEYACRAGTTTLFHTGDSLPAGFHSWPSDTGLRDRFFPGKELPPEYKPKTVKLSVRVAQTLANAWGLFDMHGNVGEWCADWYGPYEAAEQSDPMGRVDGDFRVIRGGSHSVQTRLLRSANRGGWLPQTRSSRTGFRVVQGEWPKTKPMPMPPAALSARDVVQGVLKDEMPGPDEAALFDGPRPFVKIPPNSFGPAYSAHNHSPAIAECPNGDLLAVWYSCVDEAGTELNNLASRLRRGSQEWESASLFWDAPDVNDHAPKLWWDGKDTLYHFARGLNENIVRTSKDNGVTWSKAQAVQPVCEWGNAPMRTRDGRMLITCDTTATSLSVSHDAGQTWTFTAIEDKAQAHRNGSLLRHAGIHAPIVELLDGRLMTFGRLNTPEEQVKFDFKTPASFSSDGGIHWTHQATEFPAISSVQRQVLMRLREGPLLFCSFTDLSANAKNPKGMTFKSKSGTFTGAGLFAAISMDDGKTWPNKRLITPGEKERTVNGIDRNQFKLGPTSAEHNGYLAATQTRDGHIQLITSKNHYVFNLAWLKDLPEVP
ncbi:MAG: SUMF1/EgtB/PvdO family nonheme iron enzyme [Verrucomicrobiaceae bacterium]|nr:SUMF1/EgtB/PvdO family nonheme iron enzyme [Verrucomicrobiaceae bacterium]